MKALSLKQPWAELILRKKKTIEIRSWNTRYMGYFCIHASKSRDKEALDFYHFDPKELMRGFIVGYAKLVSVKEYCSKEEFLMDMD